MAELEEILENEWRSLVDAVDEAPGPLALPVSRRRALGQVALLAQLEEVREEWRLLRAEVGAGDVERFVNAAWTLKDLVAHVASWAKEFREEVETVRSGGSFDYAIPYVMNVVGPNEWNEQQVRARRSQSLEASFDELDVETGRLQDLVAEMSENDLYAPATFPLAPSGDPEQRWRAPSAVIIAGKCIHDLHHIAQLKRRLAAWR